jgi:hypothetical protein
LRDARSATRRGHQRRDHDGHVGGRVSAAIVHGELEHEASATQIPTIFTIDMSPRVRM